MANNTCGSGNPCGACKFLRRKCVPDCIFAPYFACDEGSDRFAAIHKIFGASNASKLLLHLPVHDRCEAVVTVAYEAQARIRDPVYGCVGHIFALQQQVAKLQAQCVQVKAHLAHGMSGPRSFTEENDALVPNHMQSFPNMLYDHHHNVNFEGFSDYRICRSKDEGSSTKKRAAPHNYELGELQALAFKMMKD